MKELFRALITFVVVVAMFIAAIVAPIMLYQRRYDAATAYYVMGIFLFLLIQDIWVKHEK